MIQVAVPGINGRMGQAILAVLAQDDAAQLALALARCAKSAPVQLDAAFGSLEVLSAAPADPTLQLDVWIDFTLPEALPSHLDYCVQQQCAMVIGVTGLQEQHWEAIKRASDQIPILWSANMSIGVMVCNQLLRTIGSVLDDRWQVSITEKHHQYKKDAPSGTAKQMAQALGAANRFDINNIQFTSIREGEIVGEHEVCLKREQERIVLAHTALDRKVFAQGAVEAAHWLVTQSPGLYSMQKLISDSVSCAEAVA